MKKINVLLFLAFLFLPLPCLALTISPAKFILSADPGQTIETEMKVKNDMDQTITFYPVIERYTTAGGEEPVFYPENFGLPTWIKTNPTQVTLKSEEWATVSVIIDVPKDAEPGGHYAVLFWTPVPPKGKGTGVGIVTRVGALILLEVSGDVVESAEITSFTSSKKLFTHLPVDFTYGFKNTGNVHLKPAGEIIIKNIFGGTVASLNANPAQGYALPQTTRRYSYSLWAPKSGVQKFQEIKGSGFLTELKKEIAGFGFGYYRANLDIEYGNGNEVKTMKAKSGFFVIPWHLLTVVLLFLGILLLIFTKGIRKYNQWIIARARASSRI